MTGRRRSRLADLPRRLGAHPYRIELIALFPLFAVSGAALTDRSIAEITGLVLPMLLLLDVFSRLVFAPARAGKGTGPATALDPLTGLPLRSALEAELKGIAEGGGDVTTACFFIRLDGQSELAQRWGPEGRDEILRRTAERLRVGVRAEDLVARVEDGTFGIVLSPVPPSRSGDPVKVAERLSAVLAEPIYIGGGAAQVSASIGIAVPDPLQVADLARGAEAAVTEAQQQGTGLIRHFSAELRERIARETALTRSVDQALASGEIRAWFQPQVCTDTGEISGFEALARWHHPTLGVLSPAQFLPAIRNAGRLPRLGETMLQQALSALTAWDRKGLRIPSVAVNFSPEELRDPGLADRVKWEVDRVDMRPGRLTVEILESVAALGQDDVILRNIDQLASHGFGLDLDDFGTGQASIANIRRFHVQRIKIDRGFVTGIDNLPDQQAVVAAILSLAQHLGVETIAEGVETTGEHSILAQLGCGHVQGYGIARPMPFDETFAWVTNHRARTVAPPQIGRRTG
ncbi:EAL domain-containing protein [Rhodobacterales bacterium HKCCE2091]|nr:EAL domain-containing protein [Rhodobacterales bacterium HKCCE2091]